MMNIMGKMESVSSFRLSNAYLTRLFQTSDDYLHSFLCFYTGGVSQKPNMTMTTTGHPTNNNDSSNNTHDSSGYKIIETIANFNPKASHYILMVTLPFATGTFIGYRRAVAKAGKITAGQSEKQIIAQAPVLAAKALGLGTLASFAGVGLFVSGIMYATGASDVPEFVEYWRRWQPPAFLNQLKWDIEAGTRQAEELKKDLKNVNKMSEDEELDYIADKYFGNNSDEADTKAN